MVPERTREMKHKISQYIAATLYRIGALWCGFLISVIPLYIVRGMNLDISVKDAAENLVTLLVLLATAVVILFFVYRGSDEAAKLDKKGLISLLWIPTAVHLGLCVVLCWSKYVYIFLSEGYALARLLSPGAKDITEQSVWSVLVASLIVTAIPSLGVLCGCLAARKKREKECKTLHADQEHT